MTEVTGVLAPFTKTREKFIFLDKFFFFCISVFFLIVFHIFKTKQNNNKMKNERRHNYMLTIKEANEMAKFIAIGLPHYKNIVDQKNYILSVLDNYHLIEKETKRDIGKSNYPDEELTAKLHQDIYDSIRYGRVMGKSNYPDENAAAKSNQDIYDSIKKAREEKTNDDLMEETEK